MQITQTLLCTGCGCCTAVCPQRAVTLAPDAEGFLRPYIDEALCTGCGLCRDRCPANNRAVPACDDTYYGLKRPDPLARAKSASGGAFALLADHVLALGGQVCGAVFDEAYGVRHVLSGDAATVSRMRKSKYVQSDCTDVFAPIRAQLENGSHVLFCGTPCQAHALHAYLERPYETLLLCDLICFGVPSPALWAGYVRHIAGGGRLERFDFRDKRDADHGRTVAYVADGRETRARLGREPYTRWFLKGLSLRPSCYTCAYTRPQRVSDITIGDFWGVEKTRPEADDGRGLSLLIAHNDKARAVFSSICKNADWFPAEPEAALQDRLRFPVPRHPLRDAFGGDLARVLRGETAFSELLERYTL